MTNTLVGKSRMTSLLCAALLTGAALGASGAPAAASAPTTPPPPELAPLLQKTSELQISSERFSGEVTLTGRKLPRRLKALGGLKTKIAGELDTSPEAAAITETVLGRTLQLRLAGGALYIRDASIAKRDGGRPWIKESVGPTGGPFGADPSIGGGSGGASAGGASSTHFKSEIALVKASTDVRSLGASTIDAQPVTGFAGTLDPRQIEQSVLSAKLRKAVSKAHAKPSAGFEVFLAANGLPVRSHIVLSLGGVKLNVTQDVLAIDFPIVAIAPPPAAETISGAELKKILLKQLKKKKKK
jgi:hypothetical protein